MYPAFAHKHNDFAVSHGGRLMHLLVAGQQLFPPALIPDEEFSIDEVVAARLVAAQKAVQFSRIWCPVRQKPNPDGGVDQDNHAAECAVDAARSRRRGTSRAPGSVPRRARSRW